jgi:hypothetical protein
LKLRISRLAVIHQPVKQIRIIVLQQTDEQALVVIAERVVLLLEKRHDGDIEFAHTAAACPVDASFVVNVHVVLPASRYSLV